MTTSEPSRRNVSGRESQLQMQLLEEQVKRLHYVAEAALSRATAISIAPSAVGLLLLIGVVFDLLPGVTESDVRYVATIAVAGLLILFGAGGAVAIGNKANDLAQSGRTMMFDRARFKDS
jgi:hypothetical protein